MDCNEDSDDNEEDEASLNEAAKLLWLTDEEFLQKYRMSRKSFNCILKEIKPCAVFKKLEGKTSPPQTPVANQLMVFLKYVGTEGNGASGPNQRNAFGIGKGLLDVFRRRVTTSILASSEFSLLNVGLKHEPTGSDATSPEQ